MRREYFTLSPRVPGESDDVATPRLDVAYDGPADELRDALTDDAGEPLPAEAIDVTCRLQDDGGEATCAVGLTHRLTGEFLLEFNAAAGDVLDVVEAARRGEEDGSYRVSITAADAEYDYDMETLLVYDADGSLLRRQSLIPSGVEL